MEQDVLPIVQLGGIKIPEIVSVLLVLVNVRHVMVLQNINANHVQYILINKIQQHAIY